MKFWNYNCTERFKLLFALLRMKSELKLLSVKLLPIAIACFLCLTGDCASIIAELSLVAHVLSIDIVTPN